MQKQTRKHREKVIHSAILSSLFGRIQIQSLFIESDLNLWVAASLLDSTSTSEMHSFVELMLLQLITIFSSFFSVEKLFVLLMFSVILFSYILRIQQTF